VAKGAGFWKENIVLINKKYKNQSIIRQFYTKKGQVETYPYGKPCQPVFEFGGVNLSGKRVAKDTIFLER